jgi:hypothetical protein
LVLVVLALRLMETLHQVQILYFQGLLQLAVVALMAELTD